MKDKYATLFVATLAAFTITAPVNYAVALGNRWFKKRLTARKITVKNLAKSKAGLAVYARQWSTKVFPVGFQASYGWKKLGVVAPGQTKEFQWDPGNGKLIGLEGTGRRFYYASASDVPAKAGKPGGFDISFNNPGGSKRDLWGEVRVKQ